MIVRWYVTAVVIGFSLWLVGDSLWPERPPGVLGFICGAAGGTVAVYLEETWWK